MAKKTVKRITDQSDIDLRRWCVSEAMRWPSPPYSASYANQLGGVPMPTPQRNPIQDAEAIYNWVKPTK